MSTAPWGTMNSWLRTEGEQRDAWLGRRVQDVRAAQVGRAPQRVRAQAGTPLPALRLRTQPKPAARPAASAQPCADVA